MSALTDLFSAMATKIRSKTGTQTTYTPSEMVSDGIDDVYDAGVAAGGTSTPITPSNSSPASMTSGTKYTPSTNGYAIASYDSVTPSSTPESVASGDIVKIGGSGVIVDAIPTPTSITPSNSSPVALTADTPVNPTSGGYAIASYDNVTPSSTAVSVAADDIVKISGSGVIVDAMPPTPASITPSNTSPAALTANTPVTPTRSGYAIQSYQDLVVPVGTVEYISSYDMYKPRDYYVVVNDNDFKTITPSNTTPVSIVSDEVYSPSAPGYVISSYDSVTPSSTPESVSSGDIVKMGGSGVIVDAMPPTPTSITPSNASPVTLSGQETYFINDVAGTTSGYAIESFSSILPANDYPETLVDGAFYKPRGNGYAISSYNSVTPSNSSPVSLSSGSFYKMGGSGYAISSYSSKTPSDTSPASVSSGAIIKASSAGYLVKNIPVDLGVPDLVSQVDMSANSSRNITVTAKPRVVILIQSQRGSDGAQFLNIYDSVKDKYTTATYIASSGYSHSDGTGLPGRITTVSATTVTVRNASTGYAIRSSVLIYY